MPNSSGQSPISFDGQFVRRVLLVLLLIGLGLLIVEIANVLLMMFGAVVVAVVIRSIAGPLCRRTPLGDGLSLTATVLAMAALICAVLFLFGREITQQVGALLDMLPEAGSELLTRMEGDPLGRQVVERVRSAGEGANVLNRVPGIAMGMVSSVTTLVVIIVVGVILSARPSSYREGLVVLFPPPARPELRDAFNKSGSALKLWLIGQSIAMVTIGVLTGVGIALAGVPSALALGLFAGLAQFVPLVGPIVSAVPGLLLAASEGGPTFWWALAVYVGVQQLESNFLTPWVERRTASLPMPITLFAVMVFGALFGLPGVILATPLSVVFYVLVKELYLHDVLGEEVSLPGDDEEKSAS